MKTFILDTSIVIKWYNQEDEEHVQQAERIFDDLQEENINIILPDFSLVEAVNVFLKGKNLKASEIKSIIEDLFSLPLIFKEPTGEVMKQTAEIAEAYSFTSYDAIFVAMAKRENCQLISDDVRSHGKIKDGTVVMLKDY